MQPTALNVGKAASAPLNLKHAALQAFFETQSNWLSSALALLSDTDLSGESAVTVRSFLETVVTGLRREIVAVCRRINHSAMVSRLPREVTMEIFSFYRDTVPGNAKFKLLHVFHDWRELAVQLPETWNQIDLDAPSLAKHIVDRTTLPLSLYLSPPKDRFRYVDCDLPSALLEKTSHVIEKVNLTGTRRNLEQVLKSLMPHLVHLQSLRLALVDSLSGCAPLNLGYHDATTAPPLARLTTLRLVNCVPAGLTYIFPKASNLRTLHVDFRSHSHLGHTGSSITSTSRRIPCMWELLHSLPLLEDLELAACITRPRRVDDRPRRIVFRQLSQLRLTDDPDSLTYLLDILDVPRTCHSNLYLVGATSPRQRQMLWKFNGLHAGIHSITLRCQARFQGFVGAVALSVHGWAPYGKENRISFLALGTTQDVGLFVTANLGPEIFAEQIVKVAIDVNGLPATSAWSWFDTFGNSNTNPGTFHVKGCDTLRGFHLAIGLFIALAENEQFLHTVEVLIVEGLDLCAFAQHATQFQLFTGELRRRLGGNGGLRKFILSGCRTANSKAKAVKCPMQTWSDISGVEFRALARNESPVWPVLETWPGYDA